jgi:hypothetical protein
MVENDTYIEFKQGQAKDRKYRFAYLIETLLRSRESAGLETGIHRPDEDVNMYLTGVLCRYADSLPRLSDCARIIPYESDLFDSIAETTDTRSKYLLYRFNADHLLVTLGIFGNAWWRSPRQSAFHWAPTRDESIARGKCYYGKAATYATRLWEKSKGMDDLLGKLQVGFEEYLKILETMRSEYFHMMRSFSEGEWFHLCRDLGISPDSPRLFDAPE